MLSPERLSAMLLCIMGSRNNVNSWWTTPNPLLQDREPMQVYINEPETVTKFIVEWFENKKS